MSRKTIETGQQAWEWLMSIAGSSSPSKYRGRPIELVSGGEWVYSDTRESVRLTHESRTCGRCNKPCTSEGHDMCLGALKGIMNACCGHGDVTETYVQFLDGFCVRGSDAEVILGILKKWSGNFVLEENMTVCEKCWSDAYLRSMGTGKTQYECYLELLSEREDDPCENAEGLYHKYKVEKVNGEPISPDAQYFVLRIDTDPAARAAMLTYADEIEKNHETVFAAMIREWMNEVANAIT